MLVIPRTKHIESRMFDLPEPFKPVMELKLSSLRSVSARLAKGFRGRGAGLTIRR